MSTPEIHTDLATGLNLVGGLNVAPSLVLPVCYGCTLTYDGTHVALTQQRGNEEDPVDTVYLTPIEVAQIQNWVNSLVEQAQQAPQAGAT